MEELKKEFLDALIKEGFDILEEDAMRLFKVVFPFMSKFVLATENKVDDVLAVILPVLEPYIIKYIEKIAK